MSIRIGSYDDLFTEQMTFRSQDAGAFTRQFSFMTVNTVGPFDLTDNLQMNRVCEVILGLGITHVDSKV